MSLDVEGRNSTSPASFRRVDNSDTKPVYISHEEAVRQLNIQIKSCSRIGLFCYNVVPEELDAAHELLDKTPHRRCMRVTYSDVDNFIVKFMPGGAHQVAHREFQRLLDGTATLLSNEIGASLGYDTVGSSSKSHCLPLSTISLIVPLAYKLGGGHKEGDSCIVPVGSNSPSIIVNAGHSESLPQLQNDARRWLEYSRLDVQMVVIISIDPPLGNATPATPRITVEHWKLMSSQPPLPSNPATCVKVAYQAWSSNWTTAVPANYYILLADLFGSSPIPPIYAGHTRLTTWRQRIIDNY